MIKYSAKEYLEFFKNYDPLIREDTFGNNTWEIFTCPTQWHSGFSSWEEAVHDAMKYIKDGDWKPEETSFSRMIREIEKKEPSQYYE